MQICKSDVLAKKLAEYGIAKAKFSAQSYYVVEIENVKIFAGRNKLSYVAAINAYPGNDITHEFSPKVVDSSAVS